MGKNETELDRYALRHPCSLIINGRIGTSAVPLAQILLLILKYSAKTLKRKKKNRTVFKK